MLTGSTEDSIASLAVMPADDERKRALRLETSGGGLGHEIRNAVMPLVLLLDVLELYSADDGDVDGAQRQEAVEQLQRLANGLLLRSTALAATSAAVALPLQEWWADVGELVRMPLGRTCVVDVRLPEAPVLVLAQPPVLAQVLLHLMVSARLALPVDAENTIQIIARQTLHGLTITIRDGIESMPASAEVQDAAMAAHWGMSLAQTLLQRSGGDLSGYSAAGLGTHFTVRLPAPPPSAAHMYHIQGDARIAARHDEHRPDTVSAPPDARATIGDGLITSVLIVDDNIALTSALALRLAMDGKFECFPAMHELCDAVEQIAALQPSIVLLDLNLPGTERPLDVIRGLRDRAPDTRVIVLTGNPSLEAARGAREAGAVGFVAKGVAPERLLNVMRRATTENFMLELDG